MVCWPMDISFSQSPPCDATQRVFRPEMGHSSDWSTFESPFQTIHSCNMHQYAIVRIDDLFSRMGVSYHIYPSRCVHVQSSSLSLSLSFSPKATVSAQICYRQTRAFSKFLITPWWWLTVCYGKFYGKWWISRPMDRWFTMCFMVAGASGLVLSGAIGAIFGIPKSQLWSEVKNVKTPDRVEYPHSWKLD